MADPTGSDGLLDPASEATADRLTRTRVRDGNAVTFMPSGERSYERRWQLIEDARRTIHLVTFSVINDDTSSRLADVVAAKIARAGVVVIATTRRCTGEGAGDPPDAVRRGRGDLLRAPFGTRRRLGAGKGPPAPTAPDASSSAGSTKYCRDGTTRW
jgi:phosphatidylserine/phosphatidylglycerophosphate/cardiolipin synthase-like enzyme